VDEPVVAEIDADVREREAPRSEEDEVTGLQIGHRNLFADAAHVPGRAWQRDAGHLLENVPDEPASRPVSEYCTPLVTDADQVERGRREIGPSAARGRGGVFHRRGRGVPE
jgi:hypothetical protein